MSALIKREQLTTFSIDGDLFGIAVMKVQEVAKMPRVFPVPLSPSFVQGLVNLRGQIATALGLRELFSRTSEKPQHLMSVVCKIEGQLISLIVDTIGDVLEVEESNFELPPDTIPAKVRQYLKGIYKINGQLLSVLDLEKLAMELSPQSENSK
jgi:purine-binding chemotaxis protein CheW